MAETLEQLTQSSVDVPGSPTADDADPSPTRQVVEIQEDIRVCLDAAEDLKKEGNEHFRAKRWNEALASYRAALGRLPKRREPSQLSKGKGKAPVEDGDDPEHVPDQPPPPNQTEAEGDLAPVTSEVDVECAKARAILNANIGACFMKLEEYKEVVSACTQALQDDSRYVKALQRRAAANEHIGSWSSLSSAQEDYKQLIELLPATSPDLVSVRRSLAALPPRIEAAQKTETGEMLDKLKGLGNSILGNFGLSTDNFQFVPNGQGGYSMNFVR